MKAQMTAALSTSLLLLGVSATPALASPAPVRIVLAGTSYTVTPHGRFGIKPLGHAAKRFDNPANLFLHSTTVPGAVETQPQVYLVFWGSQWSSDPSAAAPALQQFFSGLSGSAETWGAILTQYCGGLPVGTQTCGTLGTHVVRPPVSPLAGVWFDNSSPTPTSATQAQIAAEAVAASAHFGNTTQASNVNAQYVIASPTGTHPDGFPGGSFCAWHDFTGSVNGNLAYTNLPYVAPPDVPATACTTLSSPSPLDGYFSTESHEYAETVTDAWPPAGWLDNEAMAAEIGDLCVALDARETLSTGTFDVQGLWSNFTSTCITTADITPPTITITSSPAAGGGPSGWFNAHDLGVGGRLTVLAVATGSPGGSGVASVACSDNGHPTSVNAASLQLQLVNGPHSVSCTATLSFAGVQATTSATRNVDTAPPSVLITGPTGGHSRQSRVLVRWRGTDPDAGDPVTYATSLDGGSRGGFGSATSMLLGPLRDGTHNIVVEAQDQAGNTSQPRKMTFVVDTHKPRVHLILPAHITHGARITLRASVKDIDRIQAVLWRFGRHDTATGPKVHHVFAAAGVYHISVVVIDASGNVTRIKATITVS